MRRNDPTTVDLLFPLAETLHFDVSERLPRPLRWLCNPLLWIILGATYVTVALFRSLARVAHKG